ncbi:hypothetical protein C5167_013441 [Papaver somniferum]|uniref:Uncharacterized protein n=1 Tax=Papaver somniferum TaxID=3469 RepID=A0A4Y7J4C4_PAPSO|nr:hypothetical protein C5167_013441 [Papaver somniferum]
MGKLPEEDVVYKSSNPRLAVYKNVLREECVGKDGDKLTFDDLQHLSAEEALVLALGLSDLPAPSKDSRGVDLPAASIQHALEVLKDFESKFSPPEKVVEKVEECSAGEIVLPLGQIKGIIMEKSIEGTVTPGATPLTDAVLQTPQ